MRARVPLEQIRSRIDSVDAQLHALINERARLAQQVGVSKHAAGHTVDFYRPERESQVLRLALQRNQQEGGPLRDEEVLRLFHGFSLQERRLELLRRASRAPSPPTSWEIGRAHV